MTSAWATSAAGSTAAVADQLAAAPPGADPDPAGGVVREGARETVLEEPAVRGGLVIADRVVSSIARLAALEVPGTVTVNRTAGGLAGKALPRARARVAASRAHLTIEVAVAWPNSLSQVTYAVSRTVGDRVAELTGLTVDGVDVTAETVTFPDELEGPRRVR